MNYNIKIFIKGNISFLVLLCAGGAYYLLNILLKNYLTPIEYGEYSLFMTYLTFTTNIGLLGGNNTIVRISEIEEDNIVINKKFFIILVLTPLLTCSILSIAFISYYDIGVGFIYLLLVTIMLNYSNILFSLYRVNSNFITSQVSINGWKILLFIGVLITLNIFTKTISLQNIYNIVLLVLVIVVAYSLLSLYKLKIRFGHKSVEWINLHIGFMIAVITMTIISYFDRFIIEKELSKNILGDYYYLQNFFLFPFTQLQAYVGFKKIVKFKNNFSKKLLHKELIKIAVLSVLLGFILYVALYVIDSKMSFISIDYNNYNIIIILLLLIGIVRLIYSILSSAMGARATNWMIKRVNIFTILIFLVGFSIIYFTEVTLPELVIIFLTIWASRSLLYYYLLIK